MPSLEIKFNPGQKVLFVSAPLRLGSSPTMYEVEIERIARKWIYVKSRGIGRFDRKTLEVDGAGYTSPGRCYLDRAHYEAVCRAERMWKIFRINAGYQRPPTATGERIAEAAALLGIELSATSDDG
jgi:hypothetical protein